MNTQNKMQKEIEDHLDSVFHEMQKEIEEIKKDVRKLSEEIKFHDEALTPTRKKVSKEFWYSWNTWNKKEKREKTNQLDELLEDLESAFDESSSLVSSARRKLGNRNE